MYVNVSGQGHKSWSLMSATVQKLNSTGPKSDLWVNKKSTEWTTKIGDFEVYSCLVYIKQVYHTASFRKAVGVLTNYRTVR